MSSWISRVPGLETESDRLLSLLPELLADAQRRGDRILDTSPVGTGSVLRLAQLAGIAAPELATLARERSADNIVGLLSRLALRGGPTYVKLGQLISSTKGLAPDWVADAFAGCRDAVPPAPAHEVAAILGRYGIDERLRTWNRVPLASASVAQVHEAVLDDGTEIVLKVRRPGIVRTVAADASLLLPVLRLVEARNPQLRIANLHGAVELMVRLFAEEVDLRLEAASIVEMALAFERAGVDVEIPAPIPGFVTKRCVALQYVDGVSAASVEGVARFGHRAADLVRLAVVGTLHTTLVDGIFHGDLHLGNVLVTERGLALVDFGITGRLTPQQRLALVSLLHSAVAEDLHGVIAALKDFGAVPPDVDTASLLAMLPPPLERRERAALSDHELEQRIIHVLRALTAAGFRIPPQLTLFAKNLVYLGDAINRHAPDIDIEAELGEAVFRVIQSAATTP